ncbi:hypothetical protein CTI14_67725, partial [Methylobacterium radiotolerans]
VSNIAVNETAFTGSGTLSAAVCPTARSPRVRRQVIDYSFIVTQHRQRDRLEHRGERDGVHRLRNALGGRVPDGPLAPGAQA